VGRDKSGGSIQEEKNLTGKIHCRKSELQVWEDKYLLSGVVIFKGKRFFASVQVTVSFLIHA